MLAAYHLKGHIARIVGNVGKDKERTIAVHPFKYHVVNSFIRVLGAPKEILQQFVNIMAFELRPDPRLPWKVSWLPMVPPPIHHDFLDNGVTGVVQTKNKTLFFVS
eukprot:sb/3477862/